MSIDGNCSIFEKPVHQKQIKTAMSVCAVELSSKRTRDTLLTCFFVFYRSEGTLQTLHYQRKWVIDI